VLFYENVLSDKEDVALPVVTSNESPSLLLIFIVIIEIGALCAMSILTLLIAFLTRSNGQFIALDSDELLG
jgi:hypothetical protein